MIKDGSKRTGRKRRINHDAVVAYAKAHPATHQKAIAKQFHTTQSRVSYILREAGISSANSRLIGRPPKRKLGQTEEEHKWERLLHEAGLGMDAGLRLNNQRIFYGFDPAKQDTSHSSVTSV